MVLVFLVNLNRSREESLTTDNDNSLSLLEIERQAIVEIQRPLRTISDKFFLISFVSRSRPLIPACSDLNVRQRIECLNHRDKNHLRLELPFDGPMKTTSEMLMLPRCCELSVAFLK